MNSIKNIISKRFIQSTLMCQRYCSAELASLHLDSLTARLSDDSKPVNVNDVKRFIEQYNDLNILSRCHLLKYIATNNGLQAKNLTKMSKIVIEKFSTANAENIYRYVDKINHYVSPDYRHLFYGISHLSEGVHFLVKMREDLLAIIDHTPCTIFEIEAVRMMAQQLKMILSIMFASGQLQEQRLTWNSSAVILEKVAKSEAVHPISSWTDLRRRLGRNRRVFIYTHPQMPNEPLVILHVALCPRIEHSIQNLILDRKHQFEDEKLYRDPANVAKLNTAIFYSITNTTKGLRGIDLGNRLIKKVVAMIQSELPQVYKFCTLSPMPTFASWLNKILTSNDQNEMMSPPVRSYINTCLLGLPASTAVDEMCQELKALLADRESIDDVIYWRLEPFLLHMGAKYLCEEKHRGYALDAVANFHVRNGACVWRVNFNADSSARGWQISYGLMAHYRYNIDRLQENIENYTSEKIIDIGNKTQMLLDWHEMIDKIGKKDIVRYIATG